MNRKYEKPFERKLKELEKVKEYKNLDKIRNGFTQEMEKQINMRYVCFGL
jgi:hypothetical protein